MSPVDESDPLARLLIRLDRIEARLDVIEANRRAPVTERASQGVAEQSLPEKRLSEQSVLEQTQPAPPELFASLFHVPPSDPRGPAATQAHFETQVGLTWLNRIGVITVIFGVAFFFKYAVDNGLISQSARVILGILAAFGALAFAEAIWRRAHQVYAQGITGAGIGILYLSLYASFAFYHLIAHAAAFVLLLLAALLALVLALRYQSIAIAALGLIAGYLTPLLLATQPHNPFTLFGYLLILQISGIAIVRRTGWLPLEALVLAGTAIAGAAGGLTDFHISGSLAALTFYALFWLFSSNVTLAWSHGLAVVALASVWPGRPYAQPIWINGLLATAALVAAKRRQRPRFALLAFSFFWLAAVIWMMNGAAQFSPLLALTAGFVLFLGYAVREFTNHDPAVPERSVEEQAAAAPALTILAINGFAYFGIFYLLLNRDYHAFLGLFAVVLAAVHLFIAQQLWLNLDPHQETTVDHSAPALRPILLAIGIAAAFVTVAIPIQFSGFRISLAWSIEGAALTWIAARTGNRRTGNSALLIFLLAFLRLCLSDGPMYGWGGAHALLANARFVTLTVSGICFWLGGRWMQKGTTALIVYVAGHFAVLWALVAETADWAGQRTSMGDPASIGTVSISVLLALYGTGLVALGVTARSLVNRILGLSLLGLVILKLYIYDVWQLQETFRIVAFVGLGVLLLAASFFYSRFRGVLEKLWAANESPQD